MHVSIQLITKTNEEVATAHIIVMNGHTFLNKCPKIIFGEGGGGGEQNLWPKLSFTCWPNLEIPGFP